MDNTTNKLFKMIKANPDNFLDGIDQKKLKSSKSLFTSYFYNMLDEKGKTIKELVLNTNISQSHIYQIASGIKGVGRNNAILISAAMNMNLEQTQKFLELSNNSMLYPKVRRDAIIICCIEFGMSATEINEKLEEKNEEGIL